VYSLSTAMPFSVYFPGWSAGGGGVSWDLYTGQILCSRGQQRSFPSWKGT
jgi:hypothetical protein